MKHTSSYKNRRPDFLVKSLQGYVAFFRGVLWLAVCLVLTAASGFAIVYPLWFFATGYKNLYSVFSLCVLFLAALGVFLFRLKREVGLCGGVRSYLGLRVAPKAKRAALFLAALFALYGIILLFLRGYFFAGLAAGLVYFVFLGVFLAGRREPV
ncbi:MAG: hypothetical protein LBC67_00990 [Spirochaetales bacterium]|nr:hypothetical protein [Spirochaetales bacterium]